MKKVTNITLGGFVFAVEDDAYTVLSEYLKSIEAAFTLSSDYAEIASDIESAIAEKFSAAKRNEKSAVTIADVQQVITEMGSAEDFAEGDHVGDPQPKESSSKAEEHTPAQKRRLYRNTDDAILAGVASGIATYFNIDPVIVRILFVIAAFLNGFGILAYIVLWLVVPKAETTAQKYAMRGEEVTLSHITKRVKKNLSELDLQSTQVRSLWTGLREIIEKTFEILGMIIRACFVLLRYVAGLGFIAFGMIGIALTTAAYIVLFFSEKAYIEGQAQLALEMVLNDPIGIIALWATFIAICIPLLVSVVIGMGLWVKKNLLTLSKVMVLGVIWVIAATTAGTTAALQIEKVIEEVYPEIAEEREDTQSATQEAFAYALQDKVRTELGMPIEGYEPFMFLEVFPGLTESDFEGVSANNGHYTVEQGVLVHKIHNPDVISSADTAITERGMRILLENVGARLDRDPSQPGALRDILAMLSGIDTTSEGVLEHEDTEEMERNELP